MIPLQVGLFNKVTSDETVAGFIADRFYSLYVDGSARPYAIYSKVSNVPTQTLGGNANLYFAAYQITAWSTDYEEATNVARAIQDCLETVSNETWGDFTVHFVAYQGESDQFDSEFIPYDTEYQEYEGKGMYGVMAEYYIGFKRN